MLIAYNPSAHTLEARREQIDRVVSSDLDVIVVGSVGRKAILGSQPPLVKTKRFVRDIDVTTVSGEAVPVPDPEATVPFPLDFAFKNLISVEGDTASVKYRADRPDVAVELPAELFEPFPVTVGGISFATFHPDTLLNIHKIIGSYNPKVIADLAEFKRGLASMHYPRIAPSQFKPLRELHCLALKDPELRRQKALEQAMALYDYAAPDSVRLKLKPLARLIIKGVNAEARDGIVHNTGKL